MKSCKLIKLNYFKKSSHYKILKNTREDIDNPEISKRRWINSIKKAGFPSQILSKKGKLDKKRKEDINTAIINEYFKKLKDRSIKNTQVCHNRDKVIYTKLGAEERAKWLGFKEYLQTAERFRMDVEQVETFSKYLPYAVALGVQTKWAKRFENMNINRLEWFRSQKSESIRRHDSQKIYFKHLVKFLDQIYVR